MATVINNPAGQADNTSWVGTLLAVLLVGVFLVLFFFYALPLLRNTSNNSTPSNGGTINIDIPNQGTPTQDQTNTD